MARQFGADEITRAGGCSSAFRAEAGVPRSYVRCHGRVCGRQCRLSWSLVRGLSRELIDMRQARYVVRNLSCSRVRAAQAEVSTRRFEPRQSAPRERSGSSSTPALTTARTTKQVCRSETRATYCSPKNKQCPGVPVSHARSRYLLLTSTRDPPVRGEAAKTRPGFRERRRRRPALGFGATQQGATERGRNETGSPCTRRFCRRFGVGARVSQPAPGRS